MTYKYEQTKPALRRMNSIRAFRVLDIKGNNLIVRNPYDRERTFDLIAVKNPNEYEIGDYIDAIISRMGTSSYMAQFLGKTPSDFIDNGKEIC
ncbi:MAG: hypothetical protein K2N34_01890 [Lachnospiraceae bacterium]|nr:hypothetical protein [Lachnospiraceae bacterium]